VSETEWSDQEWLARAHAWIRERVDVVAAIEQPHDRPWGTVLRVPTAAGDVWFKACIPAFGHEAHVVAALARRQPELVPPLLAVDLDQGWMLMPDCGPTLRSVLPDGDPGLDRWRELLPRYAGLQQTAVPDVERLVRAGTPDHRLGRLPGLYEALLADDEIRAHLGADTLERLGALAGWIRDECERLTALGLPETIQHDDLHDANVFVPPGRTIFFDWGDSCVSHPFFSLLVVLRSVENRSGLGERSPEVLELCESYLEPWSAWASLPELHDAVTRALVLGGAARAVAWRRFKEGHVPPYRERAAGNAAAWLEDFLGFAAPD
jgi:hypothetical protein